MNISPIKQTSKIFTEKLPEFAIKKNELFIPVTFAGTLGLSGLAQAYGISRNKKLPENEKNFMIKQEISLAVISLASLFLAQKTFVPAAKRLVEKGFPVIGRLLPKIDGKSEKEVAKLTDTFFKNEKASTASEKINIDKKHESTISDFVTATKIASTLVGQILTVNLLTPVAKNFFASRGKNKKEAPEKTIKPKSVEEQRKFFQKKFNDFKAKHLI